jgi:UDP-GlcNAc:undecaprenyl-phosphate GlcNAc-1-phosphate transferase
MENPTLQLYVTLFSISLISTFLLVPLFRSIAFRYSILDVPNQAHKTHEESVPYLGGLAIVTPVSLLVILGAVVMGDDLNYLSRAAVFLVPSVILALVGLYDDIKNSSAISRLLLQSLLAFNIAFFLQELGYGVSITASGILDFLLSVFWLVGITNAFNFIDNLDGAAAGVLVIASSTLFLLAHWGNQYLISYLSLALAGSGLGFFAWNRNPARIYLGDSGALFIGFLLAVALLQFEPKADVNFASALVPVFILAIPIVDVTVVVISRLINRVSVFKGGRDHLSHRLMSLGLDRKKTAYSLWALSALFSCFALVIDGVSQQFALVISLLMLFFMSGLVIWFVRIRVNSQS